jgi:hypothetical protein
MELKSTITVVHVRLLADACTPDFATCAPDEAQPMLRLGWVTKVGGSDTIGIYEATDYGRRVRAMQVLPERAGARDPRPLREPSPERAPRSRAPDVDTWGTVEVGDSEPAGAGDCDWPELDRTSAYHEALRASRGAR